MKKIEIEAAFGNEMKKVETSQPHATAQFGLHLVVDKHYCGKLGKQNGKWTAHLNDKSLPQFTSDDIQILGEIIDSSGTFEI
jgi:hypothetical protein